MKISSIFFLTTIISALSFSQASAQTAPSWGDAQSFAIVASSSVINTGNSVITGNIGVSPGTSISGFPPGKMVGGVAYTGSAASATKAKQSITAVLISLAQQSTTSDLSGKTLGQSTGAVTLKPGVYNFNSSAALSGTLTLDDEGNPNAIFIFKIGSTLTTASNSKVVMKGGGAGPNVFWACGSTATIGASTSLVGNVLSVTGVTMNSGAKCTGRLVAFNGSVTMATNTAAAIALVVDTDGDGVLDTDDDYPNDATKAYDNYSSANGETVAFEDQWPKMGDYDMNDLVMVSKYDVITNASNVVVQVTCTFTLTAGGTSNPDGYGVEFPIPRGNVTGLTGGILETGQTKAVVLLFYNVHNELSAWNTVNGATTSASKTYNISFNVTNGPQFSAFGTDFNPFVYNSSGASRREVHLVGKTPTSLADLTVFGTADDNSNVAAGRYYVTKTGLPFAISIPTATFSYPVENADISAAYLHFADWAQSGGTLYLDWYSNSASGYRVTKNIFVK